jgi:hypothetical protein
MRARLPRAGALAVLAVLFTIPGTIAVALEATVRGAAMNDFGRIALHFDKAVKVSTRVANGVLVISFAEPVVIRGERLVGELPKYVALVRRDPDGTALRLALTNSFRPNLLEAGERVFVDLLPQTWTGLPPGLPQEVVTELAQRAREAESKVGEETKRRQTEAPKPVAVRVARLPTLTRFVFTPPRLAPTSFKAGASEVEVQFDGPFTLDAAKLKVQAGTGVRTIAAQPANGSLVVKMSLEDGYEARGFREDETFVVDVGKAKPKPPPAVTTAQESDAPPAGSAAAAGSSAGADAEGAPPAASEPLPPSPKVLRPVVTVSSETLQITFPFAAPTAAAAFERGNLLTLVFQTAEAIEFAALAADAARFAVRAEAVRDGALAVVRLTLPEPQVMGLAPEDDRWILTIGDKGAKATEPLSVARQPDEYGRGKITVSLAEASGVHWLIDSQSGEPLAIATAFGPTRGAPKPQTFVEFRLLQTLHGVVVASQADDVNVVANPEGISIGRAAGLSVSMPSLSSEPEFGPRQPGQLLVNRDEWRANQSGAVLDRYRQFLHAVAAAPRSGISQARVDLARFLLAVGMNEEAAGIIDFAASEDATLLRQTNIVLLRGIAAARAKRFAEARKYLSAAPLLDDAEAILWRAALDAHDRRWQPALIGFRRSNLVLDLYPDEVQGPLRLLAARAGLEMKDHTYAENELAALDHVAASAFSPHEVALLRARRDEAAGKAELAAETYRKLAAEAERPVAAEATVHLVSLGLRTGSMSRDEAIPRLETLSFVWRGDEIEITTLDLLGRLYAEEGRWREAFTMAARANHRFPDHEISRSLHEETGRLFDELFLSGKGDSLSRVDALALYFDFKQFTPIGRRGDEIVRRLADRLVELDLLEQASELLQHQVEHRLTGAARATVAARLATVRLLDRKPALALATLQATRMPELPAPIRRARMLLEARALSDLQRTELAIEVLRDESGPEIERLRADVYWTGRRWREAGEVHEQLVGTRWQDKEPLSDKDRVDVLRAAVAYTLGEEKLALDRLRMKFAAKMADSADAHTFTFLTRPNVGNTRAFRDIARTVTSVDTLTEFLAEYRKRHPDAATPERRPQPDAPPEEPPAKPQVQGARGGPSVPRG